VKRLWFFSAAMLAVVITVGRADDPPQVKEGLWSIHTQSVDNPGNKKSEGTRSICRNHEYDKKAQASAKSVKGCTVTSESVSGNKYSSATRCEIAGTVIQSTGVTTFQGDTAFHTESHSTNTPPMFGVAESTVTIDQKYVGSCPAGMQPGDFMDADGKITHR
jgi:hypothetical protein